MSDEFIKNLGMQTMPKIQKVTTIQCDKPNKFKGSII